MVELRVTVPFNGAARNEVRPVPAELRPPQALPRLRRRTPQRPRAVIGEDGPAIHSWENEGGSYSNTDEPALEAVPVKHLPPGSSGTCS
jgi:hypothetical protein